ncbi:uncharacterized protein DS421_16g538450 [Arachis hypogaea]|nr:uncharacterized protein DS421_16g538450 [Arachis hypogaea]
MDTSMLNSCLILSSSDVLRQSFKEDEHIRSLLHSSKVLLGPTESLGASLQRGLQIIDSHQRNSALSKSSASFSFECLTPCQEIDKGKRFSIDEGSTNLLCESCRRKISNVESKEAHIDKVEVDKVQKDLENEMAKATMREKELENVYKEQAARIEELNQLIASRRQEREKTITCLEVKTRNFGEKCEIKEVQVQEELTQRDSSFDANEKEELLKEIYSLRSKLQLGSGGEALEKERERWTEMESEWICLTDELGVDLEKNQ